MTAAAFHFYSFEPACVMVGITQENYTYEMIVEKQEFVINIPTVDQIEIVKKCGSLSGRDQNKFLQTGLTPLEGSATKCYLIKECPLNIECSVVHQIGYEGSHRWFIGKVQAVHMDHDYSRDKALMYWLNEYRKVGDLITKN